MNDEQMMIIKDNLYDSLMENEHEEVHKALKKYPELIDEVIEVPMDEEDKVYGKTPLLTAVDFSDCKMIKMLLEEFHVNPNKGDYYENTALFNLSSKRKEDKKECVDVLLNNGADINMSTYKGKTALMLAAQTGYLEQVQTLLEHGADATMKDCNNGNALRWIAINISETMTENEEECYDEIIRLLIEHEIDLFSEDNFGYTPLTIAKKHNKPIIEKILLKYMEISTKEVMADFI